MVEFNPPLEVLATNTAPGISFHRQPFHLGGFSQIHRTPTVALSDSEGPKDELGLILTLTCL